VRWTLYRCGHVRTLIDVGADEPVAPPVGSAVFRPAESNAV
jgi:hypothetical protein